MRLVFKSVLLAVAALALSGVTAAAASANETHEWLLNNSPVEKSTPVTDSAAEFKISRQVGGAEHEEIYTCALSGKGTVSAKGAGAITAWNLTSCGRSGTGGYKCEAGTLSGPTALHLPWTTQLLETEGLGNKAVLNEVHANNELAFTWQCKVKFITSLLFKITCSAPGQRDSLELELRQVWEVWKWIPSSELRCVGSLGSEGLGATPAVLNTANHVKAEKGELSFR